MVYLSPNRFSTVSISLLFPRLSFIRLVGTYSLIVLLLVIPFQIRSHPQFFLHSFIQASVSSAKSINLTFKQFSNSFNPKNDQWKLPSEEKTTKKYHRDDPASQEIANNKWGWVRPLIHLSFARYSDSNQSVKEIFLYGQGIIMGRFERNFTAVGCLIGNELYPIKLQPEIEIFRCEVPRRIKQNEHMTVALLRDEYVERALKLKPVHLNFNLTVTLKHGDLYSMSDSTILRSEILRKLGLKMLVAVQSTVKFEDDTLLNDLKEIRAKPRYQICALTQMKQYPHLMKPWVNYHRRIGVDMVYVMDNNAVTDLKTLFKGRPDVNAFYWPPWKSQEVVWSYMLNKLRDKCEWLIPFDADEYIMTGIGKDGSEADKKPFKSFVKKLRNLGKIQASIFYLVMTRSGHVRIPKEAPPEAYIYREPISTRQCKSIVWLDEDWSYSSIHFHKHAKYEKPYQSGGGWEQVPVAGSDDVTLVHYKYRSFEELILKRSTLSAALKNRQGLPKKNLYSVDNPPPWALEIDESMKFTTFRDMWRLVTKQATMDEQTIVRWKGNQYCNVINKIGSGIDPKSEECIKASRSHLVLQAREQM